MRFFTNKFFIKFSACLLICIACSIVYLFSSKISPAKETGKSSVEEALYTRVEFFGAKAIISFPTAEARERLAKVLENNPNDAQIYLKLSELDEKLGNFVQAEDEMKQAVKLEPKKIYELFEFYRRRGKYEEEAAMLEKMLAESAGEQRAAIFSRLIFLAKTHDLQRYLQTEFYRKVLTEQPEVFPILGQYLDKLIEENPDEALKFLRENKTIYPQHAAYFLEKELSLVDSEEAEAVYHAAFDPFWTEDESREYYRFLSSIDRYRAYENELKAKFKKNPVDFDAAIRLIHFEQYDYDPITNLVLKLERARAQKNIRWASEELLTVSRLMLKENEADFASRFLYTLFLQEDVKRGKSEMRARVLYQIFKIFIESGREKLTLSRGNLQFYKNIAAADVNPGISTGILSLIFSGTDPAGELEKKEQTAAKFFNRAAAFQIFSEYKKEFPTSPQLASMYLDIVEIYLLENDLEIALQTLAEFEKRFENATDFPPVALKLAEAFQIAGKSEEERAVYQKIMDHLGASFEKKAAASYPLFFETRNEFMTPSYSSKGKSDDFLPESAQKITYFDVLQRLVASLDREKKSGEIFSFYSAELQKYPEDERLYEQFLAWLEKTNLTEEQLKIYQQALNKFPEKSWRDRLMRWFIKNDRRQEFETFSHELLQNFNDEETTRFLSEFIDPKVVHKPESFDGKLYYGFYSLAHQRFPHNQAFVQGLLKYYKSHKLEEDYRKLLAKYYFESAEIRQEFLSELAKKGEIKNFLDLAEEKISSPNNLENLPYKLFRADASAWVSNFETAVEHYRELNELYPHTSAFADRLISLIRSFGQKNRKFLFESANYSKAQADNFPGNSAYRTRTGEIFAELGDYEKANSEWKKLIETAKGEKEIYLETATVFWDYFQFPEAIATIQNLREKQKDESLYAFQAGAIYEARLDLPAALGEYVKALNSENPSDAYQTKKRLKVLVERETVLKQLENAFEVERAKHNYSSWRTLGFCEFLKEIGQIERAENLLKPETAKSREIDFLEAARNFFSRSEKPESERFAIERLMKIAGNSKKAFSYQFQLAESFADEGNVTQAATLLKNLFRENPLNYGVINESSNFLWRIGERDEAAGILQTAMKNGRGEYRYKLGRTLASRLVSLNRLTQAESVLLLLNQENKADGEVIDALTNIYVQTNQPEKMRKIADEKIKTIKNRNEMPRETRFEIIETRRRLVNAFTRLKDYRAAVWQQIEIINAEPDSEENIDEAVRYVKRFGGADALLEYYLKTSAESYKNYRWNAVLAKIYEANNDFPKAAASYQIAIHNQPENVDLYAALSEIQEKSNDFPAALDAINKAMEIGGESEIHIIRRIRLLEKLGRIADAEKEKQKLPKNKLPQHNTLAGQLQIAENLRGTERAKAIEIYRNAFDKIYENPSEAELTSADLSAYVQTVRHAENLDEILIKLWHLRAKLVDESNRKNSTVASKVRDLLSVLDGAMPEAVCSVVKSNATGNEFSAIFRDIEKRLEQTESGQYQLNSLLQNLIDNCGFTKLNEKILIKRKDEAFGSNNAKDFHFRLRLLLNFYEQQGNFSRVLRLLEMERERDYEKSKFEYERLIAENARLLGDAEKELEALRDYYNAVTEPSTKSDIYVGRYLEILYQTNPEELKILASAPNANVFRLIVFFISKREGELAHLTIENYSFSKIQKLTRNAEISLALNEIAPENERYFLEALRLARIGELIGQTNEKDSVAVGNAWFDTAEKYGRWLFSRATHENRKFAHRFLPALAENRPNDPSEQLILGKFYLEQKDFPRACEQFKLAYEKKPNDVSIKTNLGICYFQLGESEKADGIWTNISEPETTSVTDAEIYLQTLIEYGQAEKARENLKPFLISRLRTYSDYDSSKTSENERLPDLIKLLAKSFRDEEKQFKFFEELAKAVKYNSYLQEIVLNNRLVSRKYFGAFYHSLIRRSEKLPAYQRDYDFSSLLEENFSAEEAELVFDQQKNYEISEPENERLNWQREFLDYLLADNRNDEAEKLIAEIETSLDAKFARPVWLRLAKIRLDLRANSADGFAKIYKFVGIETSPNSNEIKPPNVVRLNNAILALQQENRTAEIENLKQAFYSKMLALEQFDESNFTALADIWLKRGEKEVGLKLLKLMNDIAGEEHKEAARAELAELDFVRKYSQKEAKLFETEAVYNLNQAKVLQTSGEICARYGHFAEAEFYRQSLSSIAPENESNQLELSRILWINNKADDALKTLTEIIGSRESTKKARWQAVLIAGEIFADKWDFWEKLKNNLQPLRQIDTEMWTAIETVSLYKSGNFSQAFDYFEKENLSASGAQISFLQAVIAQHSGQENIALENFFGISGKDSELEEIFGGFYEKPNRQTIRLYLKLGKPLAALKLAEKENDLAAENPTDFSGFFYHTLMEKSAVAERKSRFDLLALLSKAAEDSGEINRALNFENTRLKIAFHEAEKKQIELRIEDLKIKLP